MKISAIRTYLMKAGDPRGAIGGGSLNAVNRESTRHWLFLEVETDAGVSGVGECSGWPKVVETAVSDLANVLIGEDPAHIVRLWNRMLVAIMAHGITGTVGYGAMAGIEMALWDIKGKVLGAPVWSLLGGKVRDEIPAYCHAVKSRDGSRSIVPGYHAVKLSETADIVRKVAALRDALGPQADIMVDLHGPPWLTAADAIAIGRELEAFDLLFLEEPVSPEDMGGFRRVRDALALPLAAGERQSGLWGVRHLLSEGLIDVVQPDTGRSGGISQMMRIAHFAEAHLAQVAPHSGSLGPVAEYAAVHVMAAIPNALILERLGNEWEGRDLVITPPLQARDGMIVVPDRPGLGVELVKEEIAKYPPAANVRVPASHAADGAAMGVLQAPLYVQARRRRAAVIGRRTDGN